MVTQITARKVVVISFLVDVVDVVTNLIVALITGSATIFSEMAQGVADSIGSVFLVIGERRSGKRADSRHPLGYAREAFFWGIMSAVVMLIVGAGLSAWRGYQQLIHPEPLTSPHYAIAVIAVAIFTNGYSVMLSAMKLRREIGGWREISSDYSHPLVKGAFLRDVVGTTTSILGLGALLAYQFFGLTMFDALGALVAASLMLISSFILLAQARALITGQTLPATKLSRIRQAILGQPHVEAVNHLVAVYAGATEILIEADLDLSEHLSTLEIERLLDALEVRIRAEIPTLDRVRVLLNSPP